MKAQELQKIRDRMGPNTPRTRFAPSPTGYLHLGHVLSMLYVQAFAEIFGADILLRVEDHDVGRSKQIFMDEILADLDWLGFKFSNREEFKNSKTKFVQSNCNHIYLDHLEQLQSMHKEHLFACNCSRKHISQLKGNLQDKNGEWRYPGTCITTKIARPLDLSAGKDTNHPEQAIKFVLDDQVLHFEDLIVGAQSGNPYKDYQAIAIQNRDGEWSYHFANAVDDIEQEINLIVRGTDILSSTHRQIFLRQVLSATTKNKPEEDIIFAHHPLSFCSKTGKKLSKRIHSESIFKVRAEGLASPELLVAQCLKSVGIELSQAKIDLSSACELLRIHHGFGTF